MKKHRYFQVDEKSAIAIAKNQHISTKFSVELARELKGKTLEKAKTYVNNIINKKDFLPLKRFNGKVAHRRGNSKSGVKSGRYPLKVAKAFLKLLDNVENNARQKGLKGNLKIVGIHVGKGYRLARYQPRGIRRLRWKKSTHLEILVREVGA